MEEKKPNELSEEKLDAVAGGVGRVEYNKKTGKYDAYNDKGEYVGSAFDQLSAYGLCRALSSERKISYTTQEGVNSSYLPRFPFDFGPGSAGTGK